MVALSTSTRDGSTQPTIINLYNPAEADTVSLNIADKRRDRSLRIVSDSIFPPSSRLWIYSVLWRQHLRQRPVWK